MSSDPATSERRRNWLSDKRNVEIEDVRSHKHTFTLDSAGFEFFKGAAKTTFNDETEIEKEYYPECVELIKSLTGASKVVMFDHTIRRRYTKKTADNPSTRQPVPQVHVDQTLQSAVARVHRHLGDEADKFLHKRYQIINLWRPISHAALDWPLALCDYRSIDPQSDLVPVALIYSDREPGEIYSVKYNPDHNWKYCRGMEPDEFVLVKCFDSIQDPDVAKCAPHAAFSDPSTPKGSPLRQSIETRALVFYD